MTPEQGGMTVSVMSRADGRTGICRIAVLGPAAVTAVLDLQRAAGGTLMHPLTPAEAASMLGHDGCMPDGCMLGAFLGDRLIAFLAILFPGRAAGNLGRDYGLAESELDRVVHWTAVLVDPEFRGNRLQRRMIEAAACSVLAPERHRYWFTTVRPENIASVRGMLSVGMRIFACKPKYDGRDRYLFVRDLEAPPADACDPAAGTTPTGTTPFIHPQTLEAEN